MPQLYLLLRTAICFHFFKTQKGVTLTEILVSLTILALLGAAAIPNFRKSFTDNEFKRGVSELKNSIQKAQISFSSGTRCREGQSSQAWSVILTSTTQPTSYRLKCFSTTQVSTLGESVTLPENFQITSNTCNTPTYELRFTSKGFDYSCDNGVNFLTGVFALTVQNITDTAQQKIISISRTGVIEEKQSP